VLCIEPNVADPGEGEGFLSLQYVQVQKDAAKRSKVKVKVSNGSISSRKEMHQMDEFFLGRK